MQAIGEIDGGEEHPPAMDERGGGVTAPAWGTLADAAGNEADVASLAHRD